MILYADTNWLLNVVLRQDLQADALREVCKERCEIALPRFCVAEALARARSLENDWRKFQETFHARVHEAGRIDLEEAKTLATALKPVPDLINDLVARLEQCFDGMLPTLVGQVTLLDETESALQRAVQIAKDADISRSDAIVLAVVLADAAIRPDMHKAFLSDDNAAFGKNPTTKAELRRANIKRLGRATDAIGWVTSEPKAEGS